MKKISNRFASTDAGQVMKGMIDQREDLEKKKREAETELEKENEKSKNECFLSGSDNHRMGLIKQVEKLDKDKKKLEEEREKLVETMLGNDEDMGRKVENIEKWKAEWEKNKEKEVEELKERLRKTEESKEPGRIYRTGDGGKDRHVGVPAEERTV